MRPNQVTISDKYIGKKGMRCEYPGCHNHTFIIYIKPDEKIPYNYTEMDILRIGDALCKEHIPFAKSTY